MIPSEKFKPQLLLFTLLFALVIVANLGILAFLVVEAVTDELTETAIQKAELYCYRIHTSLEENILMSNSSRLSELKLDEERLSKILKSIFKREQTYLYFLLMDDQNKVIFRYNEEDKIVQSLEPGQQSFQETYIPISQELDVEVNGEKEKIYDVAVPMLLDEKYLGILSLGVSKGLVSEQIKKITKQIQIEYLVAGILIIVTIVIALMLIIKLIRKVRKIEAQVHRTNRMAYMGTLASGLAHEIRNPLNSIQVNSEMIVDEVKKIAHKSQGEILEHLQDIKIVASQLDNLASELLRFAKPPQLNLQPINLNSVINKVLQFVDAECAKNSVIVEKNFQLALPKIPGDANQLKQVFLNIILNANQAMKNGGVLKISTLTEDKKVRVEITDNGVGIHKDQKKKILDIFYTTRKRGTGLGLPIAQRIIEEHKATLSFTSEIGKGTTFYISFPL